MHVLYGKVCGLISDSWEFLKFMPKAPTPDSRWGSLQVLWALSFFSLGIVLTALSLDWWRGNVMQVLGYVVVIVSFLVGVGLFVYGWVVGVGFFRDSKTRVIETPILTVNKDKFEVGPQATLHVENGSIIVRGGKYEVVLKELKESGSEGGGSCGRQ